MYAVIVEIKMMNKQDFLQYIKEAKQKIGLKLSFLYLYTYKDLEINNVSFFSE